jgi:cytochrome P450
MSPSSAPPVSDAQPFRFDPHAPGYDANPYPTYRYLREHAPVYWWEQAHAWIFSRYDDVIAILRDRRFTHEFHAWEHAPPPRPEAELSELDKMLKNGLFQLSDTDHDRVRKIISPAFTPRAVERMRHNVQRIVDEAIAKIADRETVNIAADYAEHIPLRAIGSVLGVPAEFERCFRDFANAVVQNNDPLLSPEERREVVKDAPPGIAMLHELIEERRRHPADDMLSDLIRAEEEGQRLRRDELVSLVGALIAAGSETTVHLICFAVLNLLRHPDQLRVVLAEPELWRNALEEVLRFDSFGKNGVPRFAREDIQVGGATVRKGQMVYPMLSSALRDPAVFVDADVFDVRRDQTHNITFGSGPHFCIGAALARLEGQVAMHTLFTRFPGMQLASEPIYARHSFIRRMSHLEVRLRPSTPA